MGDEPGTATATGAGDVVDRRGRQVGGAVGVGILLAVLGAVLGLVMAFERREARCPDGKYFPEGTTDFRCFVHPQALEGSAIATIAAMLGILIFLVGFLAKTAIGGERPSAD